MIKFHEERIPELNLKQELKLLRSLFRVTQEEEVYRATIRLVIKILEKRDFNSDLVHTLSRFVNFHDL